MSRLLTPGDAPSVRTKSGTAGHGPDTGDRDPYIDASAIRDIAPGLWTTVLQRMLHVHNMQGPEYFSKLTETRTLTFSWICTLTLIVPKIALLQGGTDPRLAQDSLKFVEVGQDADKKKAKRAAALRLLQKLAPYNHPFAVALHEATKEVQPKLPDMSLNEALQRTNLLGMLRDEYKQEQPPNNVVTLKLLAPFDIEGRKEAHDKSEAEGAASRDVILHPKLAGCAHPSQAVDQRLWVYLRAQQEIARVFKSVHAPSLPSPSRHKAGAPVADLTAKYASMGLAAAAAKDAPVSSVAGEADAPPDSRATPARVAFSVSSYSRGTDAYTQQAEAAAHVVARESLPSYAQGRAVVVESQDRDFSPRVQGLHSSVASQGSYEEDTPAPASSLRDSEEASHFSPRAVDERLGGDTRDDRSWSAQPGVGSRVTEATTPTPPLSAPAEAPLTVDTSFTSLPRALVSVLVRHGPFVISASASGRSGGHVAAPPLSTAARDMMIAWAAKGLVRAVELQASPGMYKSACGLGAALLTFLLRHACMHGGAADAHTGVRTFGPLSPEECAATEQTMVSNRHLQEVVDCIVFRASALRTVYGEGVVSRSVVGETRVAGKAEDLDWRYGAVGMPATRSSKAGAAGRQPTLGLTGVPTGLPSVEGGVDAQCLHRLRLGAGSDSAYKQALGMLPSLMLSGIELSSAGMPSADATSATAVVLGRTGSSWKGPALQAALWLLLGHALEDGPSEEGRGAQGRAGWMSLSTASAVAAAVLGIC